MRFRDWKSRLTSAYITKPKKSIEGEEAVEHPLTKYKQITKEDWEEFVKQRLDDSFKERSENARAAQKKNEYPHYIGRAGYVGKKEVWFQEEFTQEQLGNPDSDLILTQESVTNRLNDRGYLWIKAHTPSSSAPPPQTQKVIDNIRHWKEMEEKGEFVSSRLEDVLVKAIGKPEHSGRTRGVGSYVGLQTYFGKPTSRSYNGKMYTENDMRSLIEKVKSETKDEVKRETMEEMSVMVEKRIAKMMRSLQGEKMALSDADLCASSKERSLHRQDQSSCYSTHAVDPFIVLKEPVYCRLAVNVEGKLVVVADDMVSPWVEGKMVHNVPLTMQNAHVSIDSVIRTDALLPCPWSGFTKVGDAEGSFAQWPKSLILLGNNAAKSDKEKIKRNAKSKDTKKSGNKVPNEARTIEKITEKGNTRTDNDDHMPLSVEQIAGLGIVCQSLEERLCSLSAKEAVIKMVIDDSVYNYKEACDTYLTIVEIRQMLRFEWLNIVILQVWGSFLYTCATSIKATKVVAYMCPAKLYEYMHKAQDFEDYVAHVIHIQQQNKYIMGAFFEGE
ncbi:hypothetical protein RND81_06G145100 [Saponaria officinalis]|uniref:DUF8039 domain-containing protein n=1 Tax=Saponaria officinalis TaxID=3572 RepID=A0AAW1KBG4_SAPOF